ncbi:MAG: hypothetical protein WCW67_03440 [Candidatus Margulisiibacteriota bacterium]
MKKVLSLVCSLALILAAPSFAATVVKKTTKTTTKTTTTTKTITPKAASPATQMLQTTAVNQAPAVSPANPRLLGLKAGLAGGAGLIAASYAIPMGPIYLGAEGGYAIGSGYGVIDAGIMGFYPLGQAYVGLEVTYANYSKKVKDIPGLTGTIEGAKTGAGIIAGTALGPMKLGIGYNTALGARADLTYVIQL